MLESKFHLGRNCCEHVGEVALGLFCALSGERVFALNELRLWPFKRITTQLARWSKLQSCLGIFIFLFGPSVSALKPGVVGSLGDLSLLSGLQFLPRPRKMTRFMDFRVAEGLLF